MWGRKIISPNTHLCKLRMHGTSIACVMGFVPAQEDVCNHSGQTMYILCYVWNENKMTAGFGFAAKHASCSGSGKDKPGHTPRSGPPHVTTTAAHKNTNTYLHFSTKYTNKRHRCCCCGCCCRCWCALCWWSVTYGHVLKWRPRTTGNTNQEIPKTKSETRNTKYPRGTI